MNTTRILLSIEHQLQAQLLKRSLESEPGLELIGEANNAVEILMQIEAAKPDLWIHSWEQSPELEGVLSHAYSCQPDLVVVRISPNESSGYAQLQINSLAKLQAFAKSSHRLAAPA
jgi:chemotaxis response regulator CheB